MGQFFRVKVILESEVKYAASNSTSNLSAARFLQIDPATWKKYASRYIDSSTGLTYYESLRYKKKTYKPKLKESINRTVPIGDILDGFHPNYAVPKLIKRLIKEKIKPECCEMCGFSERNISTGKVPLELIFLDGDRKNKRGENLQFLCFNCVSLVTDLKIKVK